jgi:hypothetical protein
MKEKHGQVDFGSNPFVQKMIGDETGQNSSLEVSVLGSSATENITILG